MHQLNKIPLLRFIIPFIVGITGVIYLKPAPQLIFIAFTFFLTVYLVIVLIKRLNSNYNIRWLFGVLLYANFLLSGGTLTALKYSLSDSVNTTTESNSLILGEIIEPPQVKDKTVKIILELKGIKQKDNWVESSGKVITYIQKDSLASSLNIGDIISFEPKLENVPPPKNPNEFDFRKYLSYHLIHQQAFLRSNSWTLLKVAPNKGIIKTAHNIRKNLIELLEQKGLKDKELAVASALILGYKDDIDAQLKSAYSSAGAMHVLAVSGLHVGIIFLIFSKLLFFLEKSKWGRILKGITLILILWGYALITGLSPSVMRAATMFSFVVAAKTLNRNSSFFNTLAASAFVLLIYNPLLIMEVGFQLSYLAVIGIVIIQPWISSWFTVNNWLGRQIWEITAVSLAAQIATFPLGLLYFHQFPNYFLLSNLIVIPLALAILCLGITTICFSFIPLVSDYLTLGLNYLVKGLNYAVSYIDKLPYSLSENIKFTITDTWLIYLGIVFIILLIGFRKFRFLLLGTICFVVFLILNLMFQINTNKQQKLIVYNIPQFSAINFIDGKDNVLLSDIKLTENRSKMLFHTQNNWINNGVNNEKIVRLDHLIKQHQLSNILRIDNPNLFVKRNYLQFYNTKILVIDNNYQLLKSEKKLDCDVLILTKNSSISIAELNQMFNVKEIVIDASNSSYNRKRWAEELTALNINYWDVVKNGAFEVSL